MTDSWDTVRRIRERAAALRERSARIERRASPGWSLRASEKDNAAKRIDLDADSMADRLRRLNCLAERAAGPNVETTWFSTERLTWKTDDLSAEQVDYILGAGTVAKVATMTNGVGHAAARARGAWDANEREAHAAWRSLENLLSPAGGGRARVALLALAAAARGYEAGAPGAEAALETAQGMARAAGATASEVDAALTRGQQAADGDQDLELARAYGLNRVPDARIILNEDDDPYQHVDERHVRGQAHAHETLTPNAGAALDAAESPALFDEHAAEQAALDRTVAALRAGDYEGAVQDLRVVDPIPVGFPALLNAILGRIEVDAFRWGNKEERSAARSSADVRIEDAAFALEPLYHVDALFARSHSRAPTPSLRSLSGPSLREIVERRGGTFESPPGSSATLEPAATPRTRWRDSVAWIVKNDVNPDLAEHDDDWYWQSAVTGIAPRKWAKTFATEGEAREWLRDNRITGTPVKKVSSYPIRERVESPPGSLSDAVYAGRERRADVGVEGADVVDSPAVFSAQSAIPAPLRDALSSFVDAVRARAEGGPASAMDAARERAVEAGATFSEIADAVVLGHDSARPKTTERFRYIVGLHYPGTLLGLDPMPGHMRRAGLKTIFFDDQDAAEHAARRLNATDKTKTKGTYRVRKVKVAK